MPNFRVNIDWGTGEPDIDTYANYSGLDEIFDWIFDVMTPEELNDIVSVEIQEIVYYPVTDYDWRAKRDHYATANRRTA